MMITTESITVRKLTIKLGGKKVENAPQVLCQSEQPAPRPDWRCGAIDETFQNERAGKISAFNESKRRISLPVSRKQGAPPNKRMRMDRAPTQQCSALLKKLMHHQCGWPFNQPVDPVALNIPDYFSIITEPMDLGTVKSKLEKNLYLEIEEFATDVRLTFSNAMLYNPPGNDVHIMADRLNKIFESGWKVLEAKWNDGMSKAGLASLYKQFKDGDSVGHSDSRSTSLVGSENRVPCGEDKSKSDAAIARVKASKLSKIKLSSNANKGTISDSSLVSQSICDVCGSISCRCSQMSDWIQTVSSGMGQDQASHLDGSELANSMPASPSGNSDRGCDGAGSAVDGEGPCATGVVAAAAGASCGDGWAAPLPDMQLSPKKALRAAILKSRFAATILKAQHKTLLDHGDKSDPIKLQQEKEILEQKQLEEKARIEAQIKAAKVRAEAESKKQRERDREAARIALQKMEKSVEIGENLHILKELEKLTGGSLSVHVVESDDGSEVLSGGLDGTPGKNALEQLGLFMKDDYMEDDDEETVCHVGEDGEIIS